jgi:pantothenate kinase
LRADGGITINRLGLVCDTGILRVGGSSDGVEALWQLDKLVTVAHPYLDVLLQTSEQLVDVALAVESLGVQVGMAVFASSTCDNVVLSKSVGDLLKTVTNSKNGNTEFKDSRVSVGGT